MKRSVVLVIFLLIGIALLGFGVYAQFFQTKGFEATTGTIERIDKTYRGYNDETMEDEYDYEVYVKYNVHGTEYSGRLDMYDPTYEEGKQVEVLYNPENPEDMHSEIGIFGLVLMAIGAVVAAGAIVLLIRKNA